MNFSHLIETEDDFNCFSFLDVSTPRGHCSREVCEKSNIYSSCCLLHKQDVPALGADSVWASYWGNLVHEEIFSQD